MKDTYTTALGCFDNWDDQKIEFIETREQTVFHIGHSYRDEPIQTFKCKSCGGTEFNVGSAHHLTAIRCPTCGWETVIHDG